MSKPRLLYIGHSYHTKTRSTVFLQELLAEHFETTLLTDESWVLGRKGVGVDDINRCQADHILFFQQLPPRKVLRQIRCRNLTWVPMYDGVASASRDRLLSYRDSGIKILSFSTTTHRMFEQMGFVSDCVRYYPQAEVGAPPDEVSTDLRVFFWQRMRDIDFHRLRAVLGELRPQSILLRSAPDPGQILEVPTSGEIGDHRVEIVDGWLEKPRYLELLRRCNVFMAPRRREGIGQATLEAMSHGMAVIAPDEPTMNEYIRHGVNGYLYQPERPEPLDFAELPTVRRRALAGLVSGRAAWLQSAPRIIEFVARRPGKTSWHWKARRTLRRQPGGP